MLSISGSNSSEKYFSLPISAYHMLSVTCISLVPLSPNQGRLIFTYVPGTMADMTIVPLLLGPDRRQCNFSGVGLKHFTQNIYQDAMSNSHNKIQFTSHICESLSTIL